MLWLEGGAVEVFGKQIQMKHHHHSTAERLFCFSNIFGILFVLMVVSYCPDCSPDKAKGMWKIWGFFKANSSCAVRSRLDLLSQLWSKFKSPSQMLLFRICSAAEWGKVPLGCWQISARRVLIPPARGASVKPRARTLLWGERRGWPGWSCKAWELLTCATPASRQFRAGDLNPQQLILRAGDKTAEGIFWVWVLTDNHRVLLLLSVQNKVIDKTCD